jgi:hypothetical protein
MARRHVAKVADPSAEMVEAIAGFRNDPLGFVLFVFPWGEAGTALAREEGPDAWQVMLLTKIGEQLERREVEAAEAIRLAVASGHGVGKTATVAWLILWFISTRIAPQIVVTANTTAQLTGKTWRELAKWHRLMIHQDWFQWTATRFYLKERPEDWFAQAQPWSKERAEAFAGTHEQDVLLIFDEASAIEDVIWDVAEGAMTTEGAMWVAFGNPTRNTGRFRECFRRFRHRWLTYQVDSRLAKKANRKQIDAWMEDYGEDSDFARIRIKGQFPRAATNQLIPSDVVEEAMARWRSVRRAPVGIGHNGGPPLDEDDTGWDLEGGGTAPVLLMVDVARFGDDQSVIGLRRGKRFRVLAKLRELDTQQLAHRVAQFIDTHKPDAVFVDGVGVGAGVVDTLRSLGYEVHDVNGGLKALAEDKHYNRRAEMWWLMRDWLRAGGIIPDDNELRDDLTSPEYGYDAKGRVQLETKDDMRARGLPSPDTADCLSMSFFMPVAPRVREDIIRQRLLQQASGGGSWMAH